MTDDRIWEQASIGERVEMLRGVIERITPKRSRAWGEEFEMRPGEIITSAELARLRRIEEAARAVVDKAFSAQWVQRDGAVIPALRAALDSEPKR